MTGKEHARLLGLLFGIYVAFQVVMMIFSIVVAFAMGGVMFSEFAKMPRRANEPNPEAFMSMFFVIMIVAFVVGFLFLIPKALAAYGLRAEKSWAKVMAIVACCLAVLNIPFGTALGIYGFWFIFGEEGKRYFGGSAQSATMPPPPPNNWQ
jgi:hypothetical protein